MTTALAKRSVPVSEILNAKKAISVKVENAWLAVPTTLLVAWHRPMHNAVSTLDASNVAATTIVPETQSVMGTRVHV